MLDLIIGIKTLFQNWMADIKKLLFNKRNIEKYTPNDLFHCGFCNKSVFSDLSTYDHRSDPDIAYIQRKLMNRLIFNDYWHDPDKYQIFMNCFKSFSICTRMIQFSC